MLGLVLPGLVVEDVDTVAKTMPEFTQLWAHMLGDRVRGRGAPDGTGGGHLRRVRRANRPEPQRTRPRTKDPRPDHSPTDPVIDVHPPPLPPTLVADRR